MANGTDSLARIIKTLIAQLEAHALEEAARADAFAGSASDRHRWGLAEDADAFIRHARGHRVNALLYQAQAEAGWNALLGADA